MSLYQSDCSLALCPRSYSTLWTERTQLSASQRSIPLSFLHMQVSQRWHLVLDAHLLIIGFASQFWLRRWKPNWFIKYNYVLSAALDGGTQILVFILTYTVLGGVGPEVKFPKYWGRRKLLLHERSGCRLCGCRTYRSRWIAGDFFFFFCGGYKPAIKVLSRHRHVPSC